MNRPTAAVMGRLSAAALLISLLCLGCGSSSGSTSEAVGDPVASDGGSSISASVPVQEPFTGTADGTIAQLLEYLGAESIPEAAGLYAPAAREQVPANVFARALRQQAGVVSEQETAITEIQDTGSGVVVLATRGKAGEIPEQGSFLLRQSPKTGDWVFLHDSFLSDAIAAVVNERVRAEAKPQPKEGTAEAQELQRVAEAEARDAQSAFDEILPDSGSKKT